MTKCCCGENERFHLLETAQQLQFSDIVDVNAGWNHVILTRKSTTGSISLFGFGRNDFGQLGIQPFNRTISTPVHIPIDSEGANVAVSCGSEHTLFLANQKAFVCGWNEHGNCAISSTEKGANRFCEMRPILDQCLLIEGGCGTSFFLLQ